MCQDNQPMNRTNGHDKRKLQSAYVVYLAAASATAVRAVFPLSTGGEASVSWAFVEEAKLQTDYPAYCCPAEIVHGVNDDVVPAESTRTLVEGR